MLVNKSTLSLLTLMALTTSALTGNTAWAQSDNTLPLTQTNTVQESNIASTGTSSIPHVVTRTTTAQKTLSDGLVPNAIALSQTPMPTPVTANAPVATEASILTTTNDNNNLTSTLNTTHHLVRLIKDSANTKDSINTSNSASALTTTSNNQENTLLPANTKPGLSTDILSNARKYVFSDVPANYWASKAITAVTQAGIMSGYQDGTFHPDAYLTREQAASLFSTLAGDTPTVVLSNRFKDITSDRWSSIAIASASEKNIMSGYGDNTFKPEKYMSRQEFAVVADNYLHYLGYNTPDPTDLDGIHYGDQKYIASWAQQPVRELAYLGFVNYTRNGLFNPEKYITRAEAAEITYKLTQGPTAQAFKIELLHQETERKIEALITKTFGANFDFRTHGIMFWKTDTQLTVALKAEDQVKQLGSALSFLKDKELLNTVRITQAPATEAVLDALQTEAAYYYNQQEPKGSVLSVRPNEAINGLIMTVDTLSMQTKEAFAKHFGSKVQLELAPVNGVMGR